MKTLICTLLLTATALSNVASADFYPTQVLSCKNSQGVTFNIPSAPATGEVYTGYLDLNRAGKVQFNCTKAFAGPAGTKSILFNCSEIGNAAQPVTLDVLVTPSRASGPAQYGAFVYQGRKKLTAPLACLSYLR